MTTARSLQMLALLAVVLLLDQAHMSSAKPEKSVVMANRRWFDDRLNRTTLPASFENPTSHECFALAGLFAVHEGRTEIMFPQAVAHDLIVQSDLDEHEATVTLENDTCRIKLHISKQAIDNGVWRELKPTRRL